MPPAVTGVISGCQCLILTCTDITPATAGGMKAQLPGAHVPEQSIGIHPNRLLWLPPRCNNKGMLREDNSQKYMRPVSIKCASTINHPQQ